MGVHRSSVVDVPGRDPQPPEPEPALGDRLAEIQRTHKADWSERKDWRSGAPERTQPGFLFDAPGEPGALLKWDQEHPIGPGRERAIEAAHEGTERIRFHLEQAYMLVLQAREEGWHYALRYTSWEAYVETELGIKRSRAHQLIQAAQLVRKIEAAAGVEIKVPVTERTARRMRKHEKALLEHLHERIVEIGDDPDEVIAKVIDVFGMPSKAQARALDTFPRVTMLYHLLGDEAWLHLKPLADMKALARSEPPLARTVALMRDEERDDVRREVERLEQWCTSLRTRIDSVEPYVVTEQKVEAIYARWSAEVATEAADQPAAATPARPAGTTRRRTPPPARRVPPAR